GRPIGRDVERDLYRDQPGRAVDVDPLIGLDSGRAGERRGAGGELEDRAGQDVDAGLGLAHDRGADPDRLAVERHPRKVDRVPADVVERAAAGLGLVADVAWIVVVVR